MSTPLTIKIQITERECRPSIPSKTDSWWTPDGEAFAEKWYPYIRTHTLPH